MAHLGPPSSTRPLFILPYIIGSNSEIRHIIDPISSTTITATSGRELVTRDDQKRFKRLAAKWRRETLFTSSLHEIVKNKNYQHIIDIGWPAIPLILGELRRRPTFWFAALRRITGEDPVSKEMAGNLQKMTDAWLQWGKQKRFSV